MAAANGREVDGSARRHGLLRYTCSRRTQYGTLRVSGDLALAKVLKGASITYESGPPRTINAPVAVQRPLGCLPRARAPTSSAPFFLGLIGSPAGMSGIWWPTRLLLSVPIHLPSLLPPSPGNGAPAPGVALPNLRSERGGDAAARPSITLRPSFCSPRTHLGPRDLCPSSRVHTRRVIGGRLGGGVLHPAGFVARCL